MLQQQINFKELLNITTMVSEKRKAGGVMPKRSPKYPYRVSEGEQKRYCQVKYDGYTKQPSKVEPVWLKDNYGVKKA